MKRIASLFMVIAVAAGMSVRAEDSLHERYAVWENVHHIDPFLKYVLLENPEMLAAVTDINNGIHTLSPVLNSTIVKGTVDVAPSNTDIPIDIMVKRYGGYLHVFSSARREGTTTGSFLCCDVPAKAIAEFIGEGRSFDVVDGVFEDTFDPYDVHLPIGGAGVERSGIPYEIHLAGAFPNPFNPAKFIEYTLAEPGRN